MKKISLLLILLVSFASYSAPEIEKFEPEKEMQNSFISDAVSQKSEISVEAVKFQSLNLKTVKGNDSKENYFVNIFYETFDEHLSFNSIKYKDYKTIPRNNDYLLKNRTKQNKTNYIKSGLKILHIDPGLKI